MAMQKETVNRMVGSFIINLLIIIIVLIITYRDILICNVGELFMSLKIKPVSVSTEFRTVLNKMFV